MARSRMSRPQARALRAHVDATRNVPQAHVSPSMRAHGNLNPSQNVPQAHVSTSWRALAHDYTSIDVPQGYDSDALRDNVAGRASTAAPAWRATVAAAPRRLDGRQHENDDVPYSTPDRAIDSDMSPLLPVLTGRNRYSPS
jgi:hypothetical protein